MNKRFLLLNGIAIVAVVTNHSTFSGFLAMFWWTDRYRNVAIPNYDQIGSFSYYFLVCAQKLALFCVPAFLFTSGLFLAYAAHGNHASLTWDTIKRRVLNLIPPYLIWTTVIFLTEFLLGNNMSIWNYFIGYISIEDSPLFFIPLLCFYFLISPLLVKLIRYKLSIFVALSVGVFLMIMADSYIVLISQIFHNENPTLKFATSMLRTDKIFEYFFYYAFGMLSGFYQSAIKNWIVRHRWLLLVTVILSAILAVAEAEWVFLATTMETWRTRTMSLPTFLYSISFILSFWAFEKISPPFSKLFYRIGTESLAIYLVHKVILRIVPKLVYHAAPWMLGIQIVYIPLLIIMGVGMPLIITIIVKRTPLRAIYRSLFS